jgi:hypothetical protein
VRDREEAAHISNNYAPEHLIVNVQDAESWLPLLDNAGSIFLGRWVWWCASRGREAGGRGQEGEGGAQGKGRWKGGRGGQAVVRG